MTSFQEHKIKWWDKDWDPMEGTVIGFDSEGVMFDLKPLFSLLEKDFHIFLPYDIMNEELINYMEIGSVLWIQVYRGENGSGMNLKLDIPTDAN